MSLCTEKVSNLLISDTTPWASWIWCNQCPSRRKTSKKVPVYKYTSKMYTDCKTRWSVLAQSSKRETFSLLYRFHWKWIEDFRVLPTLRSRDPITILGCSLCSGNILDKSMVCFRLATKSGAWFSPIEAYRHANLACNTLCKSLHVQNNWDEGEVISRQKGFDLVGKGLQLCFSFLVTSLLDTSLIALPSCQALKGSVTIFCA